MLHYIILAGYAPMALFGLSGLVLRVAQVACAIVGIELFPQDEDFFEG